MKTVKKNKHKFFYKAPQNNGSDEAVEAILTREINNADLMRDKETGQIRGYLSRENPKFKSLIPPVSEDDLCDFPSFQSTTWPITRK